MSAKNFRYVAMAKDRTRVKGVVRGANEAEACGALRRDGLTPIRLAEARAASGVFSFQRVTPQDIVDLTQELSVLVQSNIPVATGLMSIAEQETKPALREMLMSVASAIESGASIPSAFEPYRAVVGDIYIETMQAAQRSGNMAEVLEHLSELLLKQAETRRQMRKALSYPAIVMGVVAVAVTVIIVFVVPRFGATFQAQNVQMPLVTRAIQAFGEHVRGIWWVYAILAGSGAGCCSAVWKTTRGRLLYERLFLRLPFVRRVIVAETTSRFTRVLGLGVGSGLGMIEAIRMAGRATGRPLFVMECENFAERLGRGDELSGAISESRYLTPFARRMLTAGEDARELSRACTVVSKQYDREVGHLTGQIGTLIEPLLTLALAAVVLVVALSVFLPMWQMMQVGK
ncbi:MAG: type II secretion system F family protein [Phycisphaeraceae bacterium]|nr:type II secretion system F family protein [Phycisphaeraceae bacterium]